MSTEFNITSDFSSLPLTYGSASYTLQGNRFERTEGTPSIYILAKDSVPGEFPMLAWNDQSARYSAYWSWFNGDILNQTKQGKDGQLLYRYPLRINSLRDVVRKHTSVLFGEAQDGIRPLVETHVEARNSLTGKPPTPEAKEFATLCENIVNEVWTQSGGRTIQQEGGELCQFLGGHYYQITWEGDDAPDNWIVPIGIRSWKADYVLPIWKDNNNYQELAEVFIVYRIEKAVATKAYGAQATNGAFSTYVEHWTEDYYSIYLDGEPIVMDGKTYSKLKNPFKKVPVFYIPHLREGSFYGSSHVPDIAGLIQEYNSSMADLSDTISENFRRQRYIRNSSKRTRVELPGGIEAIDLGMQNPSIHNPPDAFLEDAPSLPDGLTKHPDKIYAQLRRSAYMPPVVEGEDEGSQRSGVTLDIRFWPITAHTKVERSFWETTLNQMATFILRICEEMEVFDDIEGVEEIPEKFLTKVAIKQAWSPQIPRDRQSLVNELLSRLGANGISLRKFLEQIGDVDNIEDEENLIKEWATFQAALTAGPTSDTQTGNPLHESAFAKNNDSIDNN